MKINLRAIIEKINSRSGFLLMISLRNLLRQKRRNILLGSAMAFGVMILIIANSFSHGISDILFNKIVVYVAGHVNITIREGRTNYISIFRDRERLERIIRQNAGDILIDFDEGVGIFSRVLGNGKAENMMIVGVDTGKKITEELRKEYDESFHMEEGKFDDLSKSSYENPVILSREKAVLLNLNKGDTLRVRYRNIYGQTQSSRFTLAGIMSNDNVFMQGVLFIELSKLKGMMGYWPYECGSMLLTIKNPQKNAVSLADRLHSALKPGPACIVADVYNNTKNTRATLIPFMGNDDEKKPLIEKNFRLKSGRMSDVLYKDGVMISDQLALKLGLSTGQKIEFRYKPRFSNDTLTFTAKVSGIFISDANTGSRTVYMHESLFYPKYYENLPDQAGCSNTAFSVPDTAPFKKAIGTEWLLLDRSRTTEEMVKKVHSGVQKRIKAATIDVNSMYESASDVLKLEGALNLITFSAVLILFFIIIIGVVNTLRMTIRERTREIGTIRAIGMQKRDVRSIFIMETVALTLISAIAGIILAFIVMGLLSLITFNLADNPLGILFVKQHLYFLPTFTGVIGNTVFILIMAAVTAYFPARKAAELTAADALRHFE